VGVDRKTIVQYLRLAQAVGVEHGGAPPNVAQFAAILAGRWPGRPRLEQGLQELGDLDEAPAVAGSTGAVAEGLGEEALPHPNRAAEDDVLVGGEPLR
jgi:hypothetical protein